MKEEEENHLELHKKWLIKKFKVHIFIYIKLIYFKIIDRIDSDLLELFDNKDKGGNITKKIGKDIKKRKQFKSKGRGITKKSYFNHENDDKNKYNKEKNNFDDKKMDIEPK